jgi:DNA-binding response OmpR family regulator
VKRAIGLGINDYVVKPIVASLLIRKIKKALLNKEFTTWTANPDEQIEINVSIDAKISAIGEAGYTLVGPFKIVSSEDVKVNSKVLIAMELDRLQHKVSPFVKNSISAGNFANDLTFIGIGESESAKIRLFIRNGQLP